MNWILSRTKAPAQNLIVTMLNFMLHQVNYYFPLTKNNFVPSLLISKFPTKPAVSPAMNKNQI